MNRPSVSLGQTVFAITSDLITGIPTIFVGEIGEITYDAISQQHEYLVIGKDKKTTFKEDTYNNALSGKFFSTCETKAIDIYQNIIENL